MLRRVVLLFSAVFVASRHVHSWNIALEETTHVDGAYGGEPFLTQPVVTVNNLKGDLDTTFEGRVMVQLITFDDKRAYLSKDGDASVPTAYFNNSFSQKVENGRAAFSDLMVDKAGEGYQLKFVLYDEYDLVLGTTVGQRFAVRIGERFMLDVTSQPENAYGGSAFGIQPVLAVTDRGGNIVRNVNEGTVTASLVGGSDGATLRGSTEEVFTVDIKYGVAAFQGLYINEAATNYSLRFITDLSLNGMTEVMSNAFSVGIGPAFRIVLVKEPSDGRVFGGKAFAHQPRAEVQDKGGNILTADSSSAIKIAFYSNPSNGTILPSQKTTGDIKQGIVQFRGLSIDKAGDDYRLSYELFKYKKGDLVSTSISVLGKPFHVNIGQPDKLTILQHALGGWAGNHPFPIQPNVALVDAGGNIIVNDSTAIVNAGVTHSLSYFFHLIVDTSNDPVPGISHVAFSPNIISDNRISYAPGDSVEITVTFTQEVTLFSQANGSILPRLALNVVNNGGVGESYAELSSTIREGSYSNTLLFKYLVSVGDSQINVDYLSVQALQSNDYSVNDAFGRRANLTLPFPGSELSLSGSKTISISDIRPSITSIDADLPAGQYVIGAGHVLDFILSFDREVRRNFCSEIFNAVLSPMPIYSSVSWIEDESYFVITYKGATSDPIPWNSSAIGVKSAIESLANLMGGVCVSRELSPNAARAGGFRWALRLDSIDDNVFDLGIDDPGMKFSGTNDGNFRLQLVSTDRMLDTWTSGDGDLHMCTVRQATYFKGSGSKTLHFRFQALPGDFVENLDIDQANGAELIISNLDDISLLINGRGHSPIKANSSIEGISLNPNQIIAINTDPPRVLSIIPQSSISPDGIYAVGDSLYFLVTFDKPVEVEGGLELILNTGVEGAVARYFSGSGTETLVLEYLVKEGHKTVHLDFKDSHSLVPTNTEGGRLPIKGYVRRKSTLPSTNANLDLSQVERISNYHNIEIDGDSPSLINVSIAEIHAGMTLERGDILLIVVQFSAPVQVQVDTVLGLMVGSSERWAKYHTGSGTPNLVFTYTVVLGDMSSHLELKYRRICRNQDCSNVGGLILRHSAAPSLDANLEQGFSDYGITIASSPESGVAINTSLSPITTVNTVEVSLSAGTYTAGTIVDIKVEFSDDVFVFGLPTLRMNTNSSAVYVTGNSTDTLSFRYTTTIDDTVPLLDWALYASTNSAIMCWDDCNIVNANDVEIDARFVGGDKDVDSISTEVALDPSPPKIVSVMSDKGASPYCHPVCSYTVGEEIDIYVVYDRPVVALGIEINLVLDVGEDIKGSRAVFDPRRSSGREIVFVYTVLHGHSSNGSHLNYVCEPSQCALELGATTKLKGAASQPTVDADLTLPPKALGVSDNNLSSIIIDTCDPPQVVAVSSITPNGTYSPGDVIEIAIEFSKTVVVFGEPFLALDVGSGDGVAKFEGGSGSTTLVFKYEVGVNHRNFDLDYVDVHSLYVGDDGAHPGSIRQASTHPTVDALLDLPFPSTIGSLGHSSDVAIDNRTPYIVSVSANYVDGASVYKTGDKVRLQVQFSRPVIVHGIPSLKLETGIVDRSADFESQLDERTLQFAYIVRLGDSSPRLDYWSNDELFPSSTNLQLNGGWIKCSSANPQLMADVHLNPVGGHLDGNKSCEVNEGVATFRDLKIDQRGNDYQIRYRASPIPGIILEVSEVIQVGISIEYQVLGDLDNRDPGDQNGSAISIHRNMLAVGAPGKRNPIHEVQVLTVYSETSVTEHEVQIITTSINKNQALMAAQEFSTCADAEEKVGGKFALKFKADGNNAFVSHYINFESDTTAEKLKTTLETELTMAGLILTSRSINSGCESLNSWTWSVTFLDTSSRSGILETYGDGLLGLGAHITPTSIARTPNLLRGTFNIINPSNGRASRPIPHDASASFVKEAIEIDLSIAVRNVQVENMDRMHRRPELGRRWIIFFSHHIGEYGLDINIPQLDVCGEDLRGSDARVWSHTSYEGRGILSGSFAVSFRGSGFSEFVSYDASEDDIASALLSLESINNVSVSERREFSNEAGKSGFSWTITYISVNKLTEYGWLLDPNGTSSIGNLPALEIQSHLIGWNARYKVESESGKGSGDAQAHWMQQKMGDDGRNSGSVEVFRQVGETWRKEATIVASDYNSQDLFGSSVSIADDYLLVGAPSKEVDGLREQQTLTCTGPASEGFFTIGFRGFESSPIPFDATIDGIKRATIGTYGETSQIHTFPRLVFSPASDDWDGFTSGFCSGGEKSVSITFITPDGGGISTIRHSSGDIEDVSVASENLIGATLVVSETRVGTRAPMGKDMNLAHATGTQSGSAYLYKRTLPCITCVPSWVEHQKFTPLDGLDDATGAALFGWSSKFVPATESSSALVVIGSPGFDQESGKVYIFEHVNGYWKILDSLTDQNWNHNRIRGARFGSALDADNTTVLVGSPGYSNGKGAVYLFQRSHGLGHFLASQAIYGPDDLEEGDQFGHSVSLSGNKAAICAPYKAIPAIHVDSVSDSGKSGGSCYIFSRKDKNRAYEMEQQLEPSNILSGDRFGWQIAMHGNKILVGQVENFTGKLSPPRPVQIIKTFCKAPPCQNANLSQFRLHWMRHDKPVLTPYLSANISDNRMRQVLENTVSAEISVTRSVLPDSDGGHSWCVTFNSYKSFLGEANKVPAIHCEMSAMSSLDCSVQVESEIPRNIRSKSHLFDFDETNKVWTEQAFLLPSTPQRQDMIGASVAIDGNVAAVGAPNRELLNINSGAAYIYDVNFLKLKLVGGPFTVTEGEAMVIEVARDSSDEFQLVSLRTVDRNAESDFQDYVNELYSLQSIDLAPYSKTSVDLLTGSTAFGRSQYYGSIERRSLFINGQYDFQGINDYELLSYEGQFKPNEQSILTTLRTNNDVILEKPNESVTFQINLRGMFASQLGRLQASLNIMDDRDGKTIAGETHYQLLDDISHEEFSNMGAAIDYDDSAKVTIVGSDHTSGIDGNGKRIRNVGSAHIFKKSSDGWVFIQTLSPPFEEMKHNMLFGQSVAIHNPQGRNDTTILIGAPGAAVVYVYSFQADTNSWIEQGRLSTSEATLPEHRFGGAIALYEDVAFVGAPGLEAVYVFRRSYISGKGFITWDIYDMLRCSDYDFDIYGQDFTSRHIHHQAFGVSLAARQRSLLVGAPFADYGNRGSVHLRENINTDGVYNQGLGKGKVYAFYSQPHVQLVKLISDETIMAGSFRLGLHNHRGVSVDYSGFIEHDSSPIAFKVAIEMMRSVGEVYVEKNVLLIANSYEISWRITFISSFEDNHPLLFPQWRETGCEECAEFRVSALSMMKPHITTVEVHSQQGYIQEGELQPRDVTSADLFGSSIDLDGLQAIVGSRHSAAKTRTTWDFETGDLTGWSATGDAFRFQPTHGDNSKHRTAARHLSVEPQSSRLTGTYYIGTFEKHPRDKDESYEKPSKVHPVGTFQGDEPRGTLTSDAFVILGDTISFLIGGGCNHLTVYVELLVDGFATLRATGKCNERMEEVQWDVSDFKERTGQIRIVDNGSSKWDHINVDGFKFSWDMGRSNTCLVNNWGECHEGGGVLPKSSLSDKQHYTGREESAMSGAAYLYRRECPAPTDLTDTSPSNSNCIWIEEERITASDKRPGNLFGISVSVDDRQGVAIVGSSNSPAYGFYQEPVFVHPHSNTTTYNLPVPEHLEHMMKSGLTYSATSGSLRVMDYLARINKIPIKDASKFTEQAGTTYVFVRESAKYGPGGELIQKSSWRNTEHAKIAPPDVAARDHFGYSVSLGGKTAVMGAIGRDGHANEGGGAFAYDMEWVRVKFSKVEFTALEGTDRRMKIFVQRDLAWSNSVSSIGYSTSDLSAVGVDTLKYEKCMKLHSSERDGCGDYEQAAGEVVFSEGEEFAYFVVRIIDDLCTERNIEYAQLNLHLLGGSPIRGENYRAKLRIDDNDWEGHALSMECKGGIS
ncbi:hypothetical protein HJC23_013779 [Cyclotella cryptica]|uniref:Calx-beta domain-containing protein n=1 Tax=Cyclotella cryptica TaxID=29204 RepID=A0ABD3PGK5_9STRA